MIRSPWKGRPEGLKFLGFCCTDHSRDADLDGPAGRPHQAKGEYGVNKRGAPEQYLPVTSRKGRSGDRRASPIKQVEYPVVQRRGELDTQVQPG